MQALTRSLLAAGSTTGSNGKDQYLLRVTENGHGTSSYLQFQQWSGDTLIKQSTVGSVRPKSTATYLTTRNAKLAICVSPSSTLRAHIYVSEDRGWKELNTWDEETGVIPLPVHNVHPEGRLAGTVDSTGRVHIVFQNKAGRLVRLVYLMNSWFDTVLTANPVAGSPLDVGIVGDTLHVFYISAVDGYIHDISSSSGNWYDGIPARKLIEKGVKSLRMVVGCGNGDEKDLFILTKEDRLLRINMNSGRLTELGVVKAGNFVSERIIDQCVVDAWNGTLTADMLESHLHNDPTCIDNVGSDHAVTPLAAATIRGHVDIVRLLLQHNANPNALSSNKTTPLYFATSSKTISDPSDRLSIVRLLLDSGANVDECHSENGFNTPLTNAITLLGDQNVIDELLKHGGSPNGQDATGKSARSSSRDTPLEVVKVEKLQEVDFTPFERKLIEFLVALIVLVVEYTKNHKIKDMLEHVVVKLKDVKDMEN